MLILFLISIPILFILIRLILYLTIKKYGKFSYDGFSAVGFVYNSKKDIFYSSLNAWQKNFGYTYMYDVLAPICRMIIDTEPIRFNYNNKNWLITFWKGQYGIATGAEIGIYYTKEQKINKKTIYLPVSENEMLNMDLILYKNGKVITKVKAKHWWLAIFKLGMFSNPKDLAMDININFPNQEMLKSFLESFKKLGYTPDDFKVIDHTFCFKYIKPHTRKVWTRNWLVDSIRQFFNHKNVELYSIYLEDLIDNDRIDDSIEPNNKNLIMLNNLIPNILKNDKEDKIPLESIKKNIYNENIVVLSKDIYKETRVKKL